jgi:tetratricopeptide (TPR) repeat protein
VAALAEQSPEAKFARARAHVARMEWKKAAACYAEGIELEPTDDGEIWFEYAATQLLAGDRAGYHRACAHMLARCQSAPQMRPYHAARASTLSPNSPEDVVKPHQMSAKELTTNYTQFWSLTERGALSVRIGLVNESVKLFQDSLVADGRPGRAVVNWLWLAIAHKQLGQPEEARRWLGKATNWLNQQGGRMPRDTPALRAHLHNWLEAQVLRREAEALPR